MTPLVLLLNFSGCIAKKSGKSSRLMSSVCSRATPLTLCEPTVARCAMRTCCTGPSSTIDMRESRAGSPGQRVLTSRRKRWLIS